MVGYAPRGPLLGGAPPPQLGQQPTLGGWQPSLDFLTQIPGAIQQATGWQPGTTPQWVPDWLRNLSAANTAQQQATQQNLAALPPRYAMTPQDLNIAMSLGMTGGTLGEGGGLRADMPAPGGITASPEVPVAPGITAYHGSPYSFERFDISKIGTGEGAQAYGHGLYFAESEPVAMDYRNKLAGEPVASTFKYGGQDVWGNLDNLPPDVRRGAVELHGRLSLYKDPSQAVGGIRTQLENTIKNYETGAIPMDKYHYEDAQAALKTLNDPAFSVTSPQASPGSMYQVRINADPAQFLDWDKPFAEQSPQVQDVINKLWLQKGGTLEGRENPPFVASKSGDTGENIHAAIATTYGRDAPNAVAKAAGAQALRDAGIPGIRYLDRASRAGGEGTHNYVVFSDQMIDILKKYGVAGLAMMGGGGLAAAAMPNQAQAAQSK